MRSPTGVCIRPTLVGAERPGLSALVRPGDTAFNELRAPQFGPSAGGASFNFAEILPMLGTSGGGRLAGRSLSSVYYRAGLRFLRMRIRIRQRLRFRRRLGRSRSMDRRRLGALPLGDVALTAVAALAAALT
jgi:hypothetical protein